MRRPSGNPKAPLIEPPKTPFGRRSSIPERALEAGLRFAIKKYAEHLTPLGYALDLMDLWNVFHKDDATYAAPTRNWEPTKGWVKYAECASPQHTGRFIYDWLNSIASSCAGVPLSLSCETDNCLVTGSLENKPNRVIGGSGKLSSTNRSVLVQVRFPAIFSDAELRYVFGIPDVNAMTNRGPRVHGVVYSPFFHPLPWPDAERDPFPLPALDPLSVPIGVPQPVPQPLPWKAIPSRSPNPFRSPTEQTQRGYAVPEPVARTNPVPDIPPSVSLHPGGKTTSDDSTKNPRKPPKRTKEQKRRAGPWARLALRIVGEITEYDDALNSLFWALPDRIRREYHGPNDIAKAQFVYRHFGDVDIGRAILNMGYNELQDLLYSLPKGPDGRTLLPTRMGHVKPPKVPNAPPYNPARITGDAIADWKTKHGF